MAVSTKGLQKPVLLSVTLNSFPLPGTTSPLSRYWWNLRFVPEHYCTVTVSLGHGRQIYCDKKYSLQYLGRWRLALLYVLNGNMFEMKTAAKWYTTEALAAPVSAKMVGGEVRWPPTLSQIIQSCGRLGCSLCDLVH